MDAHDENGTREPNVLDPEGDDTAEDGVKVLDPGSRAKTGSEPLAIAPSVMEPQVGAQAFTDALAEKPAVEPVRPVVRKTNGTVRELVLGEIYDRGTRASRKLKTQLSGLIQLNVYDLKESYLFDWQGADFKVEARQGENPDCVVQINASDLMGIAAGDLNPQVAMLSDKVRVSGKAGLAVYLFNLFAPPVSH